MSLCQIKKLTSSTFYRTPVTLQGVRKDLPRPTSGGSENKRLRGFGWSHWQFFYRDTDQLGRQPDNFDVNPEVDWSVWTKMRNIGLSTIVLRVGPVSSVGQWRLTGRSLKRWPSRRRRTVLPSPIIFWRRNSCRVREIERTEHLYENHVLSNPPFSPVLVNPSFSRTTSGVPEHEETGGCRFPTQSLSSLYPGFLIEFLRWMSLKGPTPGWFDTREVPHSEIESIKIDRLYSVHESFTITYYYYYYYRSVFREDYR